MLNDVRLIPFGFMIEVILFMSSGYFVGKSSLLTIILLILGLLTAFKVGALINKVQLKK